MKIKKGDTVKVIAGKDKGKTGRVTKVLCERNRVQVEGVAQYKRHLKPGRSQANPDGGIIDMTGSINASNVMIMVPGTSLPARVGYQFEGDKKVRVGRGKAKGALLDAK